MKILLPLSIITLIITLQSCSLPIWFYRGRISDGNIELSKKIDNKVSAKYETTPIPRKVSADAADDPAIWVNDDESYIIGTDKRGGLAVYTTKGEQVHYYEDGKMNNVDVCYNFSHMGTDVDLVVASNRTVHSLELYTISKGGKLTKATDKAILSKTKGDVYGICFYQSKYTNDTYIFVNSKKGEVHQWRLKSEGKYIGAELVREFSLGKQTEGMVADNENSKMFIGVENKGIYTFNAEPSDNINLKVIESSRTNKNKLIRADIEGLSLYTMANGDGYLLASSQGNYSYAVFNRKSPHSYLGSFTIADGVVDGVQETDGIDVFSTKVNSEFTHGMLVVQDGFNFDKKGNDKEEYMPQNFKIIDWKVIAKKLNLNMN